MVGTKNLALAADFIDGAEADWKEFVVVALPPLLNVSTYLDRTPILPRAENWFWLGGIGGIPELCSKGGEFGSGPPLADGTWLLMALLML